MAESEGFPAPGADLTARDLALALRRQAMDLLARREYPRSELTSRLVQRATDLVAATAAPETLPEPAAIAAEVVQTLAEEGLQSDERYVEVRVRSGIRRGHGPLKIRAALSRHPVDSELVALQMEGEADAWRDRLDAILVRRFGNEAPADRREWARRARFAASRGFPESLVVDCLGDPPRR